MTDFAETMALALLNCLCTNVAQISTPPQHCRLSIGNEQAHDIGLTVDLCCEGLAYVALGETYPSVSSFPDQDIVRQVQGDCSPPSWGQQYQVGIVRCAPVGDLNPPTDTEWTAAALLNIEDAAALRRTACCFRAWMNGSAATAAGLLGMSVVINRQTQSTPQGGCVERAMTIIAQFPNCDCV